MRLKDKVAIITPYQESLSIFSERYDPTTSASRLKKEMCANIRFFSI
jgi:hypothetical protein